MLSSNKNFEDTGNLVTLNKKTVPYNNYCVSVHHTASKHPQLRTYILICVPIQTTHMTVQELQAEVCAIEAQQVGVTD